MAQVDEVLDAPQLEPGLGFLGPVHNACAWKLDDRRAEVGVFASQQWQSQSPRSVKDHNSKTEVNKLLRKKTQCQFLAFVHSCTGKHTCTSNTHAHTQHKHTTIEQERQSEMENATQISTGQDWPEVFVCGSVTDANTGTILRNLSSCYF